MSRPSAEPDGAPGDPRLGDPDRRDADARHLGTIDDRTPEPIDPAHRAAVEAGLADMRARRLATTAAIEKAYARFGRGTR